MKKTTRMIFLGGILLMGVALVIASGLFARRVHASDLVTINYSLSLDNGKIYSSTYDKEPVQVTLGQGKLIEGFEEAVIGMKAGERKTVTIPPEKAYGPYHPELVEAVDRSLLPEGVDPFIGQQLQAEGKDSRKLTVTIIAITDTTVTADINPPMAGHNLIFDIELVAIGRDPGIGNRLSITNLGWVLFTIGLFVAGYVSFTRKGAIISVLKTKSVKTKAKIYRTKGLLIKR